jgi:hypothetical protein
VPLCRLRYHSERFSERHSERLFPLCPGSRASGANAAFMCAYRLRVAGKARARFASRSPHRLLASGGPKVPAPVHQFSLLKLVVLRPQDHGNAAAREAREHLLCIGVEFDRPLVRRFLQRMPQGRTGLVVDDPNRGRPSTDSPAKPAAGEHVFGRSP